MSDWQVGDLAVCVRDGENFRKSGIRVGGYYKVTGVVTGTSKTFGCTTGLVLAEAKLPRGIIGVVALYFRKIRPDEQAGEREDWELLLDSVNTKQREQA